MTDCIYLVPVGERKGDVSGADEYCHVFLLHIELEHFNVRSIGDMIVVCVVVS